MPVQGIDVLHSRSAPLPITVPPGLPLVLRTALHSADFSSTDWNAYKCYRVVYWLLGNGRRCAESGYSRVVAVPRGYAVSVGWSLCHGPRRSLRKEVRGTEHGAVEGGALVRGGRAGGRRAPGVDRCSRASHDSKRPLPSCIRGAVRKEGRRPRAINGAVGVGSPAAKR